MFFFEIHQARGDQNIKCVIFPLQEELWFRLWKSFFLSKDSGGNSVNSNSDRRQRAKNLSSQFHCECASELRETAISYHCSGTSLLTIQHHRCNTSQLDGFALTGISTFVPNYPLNPLSVLPTRRAGEPRRSIDSIFHDYQEASVQIKHIPKPRDFVHGCEKQKNVKKDIQCCPFAFKQSRSQNGHNPLDKPSGKTTSVCFPLMVLVIPARNVCLFLYLGKFSFWGKSKAIDCVCPWVTPLAKLLRRLRECHVRCNGTVYHSLEKEQRTQLIIAASSNTAHAPPFMLVLQAKLTSSVVVNRLYISEMLKRHR